MTFALEVIHPKSGALRVELVTLRMLTLYVNGYRARRRPVGRGNPQVLIFDDSQPRVEGLRFYVLGDAQWPEVNGVQQQNRALKHGDVVRWHDYQVTVFEVQPLDVGEWAMVDAARSNDAALHVYADWLETRGSVQNAEWARLSLSPERQRMNELAASVAVGFRALVARGPVERCGQPACGQRWEKLSLKPEPCARECTACQRQVTWCEDSQTAQEVLGPVVLDPATPRAPGDLIRVPPPVG